jgi:hypothetical protein
LSGVIALRLVSREGSPSLLEVRHTHTHTHTHTLLLHIPLLALTDGWTEGQTERQIHLLRVGWRNFFSSCAVVSVFWLWREIVLGVTYLPYQLWCCVIISVAVGNSFGLHRLVFWLWREVVLGVTYYLSTIPVVPLCQFFGCGRK